MNKCFLLLLASLNALAQPTLKDMETLAHQVESKGGVSLESLLQAIGENFPELRENYVLMHQSLSRQEASFKFPRVISRSQDSRFIMTFNGNPDAGGFNEIEMMEFSKDAPNREGYQSESFKFRRIGISQNRFILYPINERLCQSCHEERLRPNWESYNKWEGAYPETDDVRRGRKYYLDEYGPLYNGFDSFFQIQETDPRYRFLKGIRERFVVDADRSRTYLKRVDPSQFTQDIANLNYRRIAHLIFQSPDYQKYKFAILGALYNCPQFEKSLPKSFQEKKPLNSFLAETKASFEQDSNNYFLMDDIPWVSKIRYVMENRGVQTNDWSMSFRRSKYSFVTPGGMPEGFLSALLIELDPSLEPFRVYRLEKDSSYGTTTAFVKHWTGSLTTMVKDACGALENLTPATP